MFLNTFIWLYRDVDSNRQIQRLRDKSTALDSFLGVVQGSPWVGRQTRTSRCGFQWPESHGACEVLLDPANKPISACNKMGRGIRNDYIGNVNRFTTPHHLQSVSVQEGLMNNHDAASWEGRLSSNCHDIELLLNPFRPQLSKNLFVCSWTVYPVVLTFRNKFVDQNISKGFWRW